MARTIILPDGGEITVKVTGWGGTYRAHVEGAGTIFAFSVDAYYQDEAESKAAAIVQAIIKAALRSVGQSGVVASAINSPFGVLVDVKAGHEGDVLKLYKQGGKKKVVVSSGKSGSQYVIERVEGKIKCSCTSGNIRGTCRHSHAVLEFIAAGSWSL